MLSPISKKGDEFLFSSWVSRSELKYLQTTMISQLYATQWMKEKLLHILYFELSNLLKYIRISLHNKAQKIHNRAQIIHN